MSAGDTYRAMADELCGEAAREASPTIRVELEALARSYVRLARQADQNARNDVDLRTAAAKTYQAIDGSERAPVG